LYQIKILDKALEDIEKGLSFYQAQDKNLGVYFLDNIIVDIESLQLYAGIHKKVKSFYRLLAKRFPYAIYYKIDQNIVYIYAVLDCRMNPLKIKQRLEDAHS